MILNDLRVTVSSQACIAMILRPSSKHEYRLLSFPFFAQLPGHFLCDKSRHSGTQQAAEHFKGEMQPHAGRWSLGGLSCRSTIKKREPEVSLCLLCCRVSPAHPPWPHAGVWLLWARVWAGRCPDKALAWVQGVASLTGERSCPCGSTSTMASRVFSGTPIFSGCAPSSVQSCRCL